MTRAHRPPTNLAAAIAIALLVALTGCEMETRVIREPWWNQLPADARPGGGDGGDAMQRTAGHWAIPLERFRGSDRLDQARELIARLERNTTARDLWVEDTDGAAVVFRGRFTDPASAEARQALQHTRRIRLDDTHPFTDARLINVAGDQRQAAADPHDLSPYTGYYTLQIGFYDVTYGRDFREAAERAVRELRNEDHEAYYYHGPHRSLVTVGLFRYEQAFVTADDPSTQQTQVDVYAPAVRELQRQFPYNLGNGVTLIEYERGEEIGELESVVVRVF